MRQLKNLLVLGLLGVLSLAPCVALVSVGAPVKSEAAVGDTICSWTAPNLKPANKTEGEPYFVDYGWSASSYTSWYKGAYKMDKVDKPYVTTPQISNNGINYQNIDVLINAKVGNKSTPNSTLKVIALDTANKELSNKILELTNSYPANLYELEFHESKPIGYFKFCMGNKIDQSNIYFNSVTIKEGAEKIIPTSVTINPKSLTIKEFESSKLTAKLGPDGASGIIDWTSSDPTIASVDSNGNVTGLKKGLASITATVRGTQIKDKCDINVIENESQKYSIVKSLNDINIGAEYIITNINKNLALGSIGNNNFASQVDLLNVGDFVIEKTTGAQIFKLGGSKDNYTFYNNATSKYLGSSLSTTDNELKEFDQLGKGAYWSISEINVDTFAATIKANTTNTSARNWLRYNSTSSRFACYGSGQNDILLFKKVTPPVASVTINEQSQTIDSGETLQLSATVLPANAAQSVIWESDQPNVVEVNRDNGLATAISKGTANITAKSPEDNSKSSTIAITVQSNPIVSISCVNLDEMPVQYIGEEFNNEGLRFEATRQDNIQYPIDLLDISYELYQGTTKQPDLIVNELTTKAVAYLKGTSFKIDLPFTPVINKACDFIKVTDVSSLVPGARVILTNNAADVKALSTKQTSYDKASTPVNVTNGKISIKYTELETTPIAIYDVGKGLVDGTLSFYDGRCSIGQGYLGFQYSAKGDHYNIKSYIYLEDANRDWTVSLHTDNTISMSSIDSGKTGYLNIDDKGSKAGAAISAVEAEHVNMYLYNPTIEEKILSWGHNQLRMNDPDFIGEGTGKCTKNYGPAKKTLNDLGNETINALKNTSSEDLMPIKARYEKWAAANNDANPYDGLPYTRTQVNLMLGENKLSIIVIVSISILAISAISILLIHERKKALK